VCRTRHKRDWMAGFKIPVLITEVPNSGRTGFSSPTVCNKYEAWIIYIAYCNVAFNVK
jgi:hypothetical protein